MSGGGYRPASSADQESGRQFVMNRREYLGAVAGLAVATAGCLHNDDDGIEESDWHTVRGDPARSGITTADAGPGESLSVAWRRPDSDLIGELEGGEFLFEPGGEFSHPVLYDGYCIYVFKYRAFLQDSDVVDKVSVIALSQEDGSLVWQQQFLEGQEAYGYQLSSPEVVDGSVYVRSPGTVEESFIDVLDADSGEYSGRIELDQQPASSVIHDGTLYSVYHGGYSAFDLEKRSTEWQDDVMTIGGTPVLMALASDTVVYTGSNHLAARDTDTGELVWETDDVRGGPVMVGEDRGYLGSIEATYQQRLVAFDLSDGSIAWEFTPEEYPLGDGSGDTQRFVYGIPVVRDDLVLTVASGERTESTSIAWYLYALDRADGTEEWSVRLGARHPSAPVVAGETIYAGNSVISLAGEELDSVDNDYRLSGYPAVGNGRVYSEVQPRFDGHRLAALE